MLSLPHDCRIGKISVHPANWQEPGAKTDKDWYIHYRFHHPDYSEKYPKGFLKITKGMNEEKGLVQRRNVTRGLIKNEIDRLEQGYNPILNVLVPIIQEGTYEIHPATPFARALQAAYELLPTTETKREVRHALVHIKAAITDLKYDGLKIADVRKRHMKAILRKVEMNKKQASGDKDYIWGAPSFNHYRAYLIMLFDQLEEEDAIEADPVSKIKKRTVIKKIRKVLTPVERVRVDAYLRFFYYGFWRYTHIFFHSGARTAEMMRLRLEDVDLKNQRFKVLIKKGGQFAEKWKTIKNIAVPFWEDLLSEAKPGDYLFSRNLNPGRSPIRRQQITARWSKHVKKDLGIDADFYSFKYLNTTQTVNLKGYKAAADQNSHTTTAMVVNIYDTERGTREHEELKTINNPLV